MQIFEFEVSLVHTNSRSELHSETLSPKQTTHKQTSTLKPSKWKARNGGTCSNPSIQENEKDQKPGIQ